MDLLGVFLQFAFDLLHVVAPLLFGLFEQAQFAELAFFLLIEAGEPLLEVGHILAARFHLLGRAAQFVLQIVDLIGVDGAGFFEFEHGAFERLLLADHGVEFGLEAAVVFADGGEFRLGGIQLVFELLFEALVFLQLFAVVLDLLLQAAELRLGIRLLVLQLDLVLLVELSFLFEHLAVVLEAADVAHDAVEFALPLREGLFLVEIGLLLRFQLRFELVGLHFDRAVAIFFGGELLLHRFLFFLEVVDLDHPQFDAELLVALFELEVFLGAFGLFLQRRQVALDLVEEVFDPFQVVGRALELVERFAFADLVFRHAGGLFEHAAASVLLIGEDVVDHAQGDDGVRVGADARVEEERGDVLEPAGDVVQPVLAFAATIQDAGDGDGVVVGRQQVLGILEGERYRGHTGGFALLSAVEDDAGHLVEAKLPALLFSQHPADRIHDVRLPRAVRAHDADHILVEVHDRFVGKALEALYFQRF